MNFLPQIELYFNIKTNISSNLIFKFKKEIQDILKENNFSIIIKGRL